MGQSEFVRIIGPLIFRGAEKFFKFISWAIIIVALNYATERTQSVGLRGLSALATIVFASALVWQGYYIMARDPSDWKIPPRWHSVSYVVQFLCGMALVLFIASPYLPLDGLLNDLMKARN